MSTTSKAVVAILAVVVVSALIYWQQSKKDLLRKTIGKAVQKSTDSLYRIQYDSSVIDEVNGNVAFYNVRLQSDSIERSALAATDSLPGSVFSVRIASVRAYGIDVAGLLQKQNISCQNIVLSNPVITINLTGNKSESFSYEDTLALYKRILGRFRQISAATISIENGYLRITDTAGKTKAQLQNINVTLHNLAIDAAHNYDNIISYFIKDVKLTVETILLSAPKSKTIISMNMLDYDAARQYLAVKELRQSDTLKNVVLTSLKNIKIDGLSTRAFIIEKQLKAAAITCGGGSLTILTKRQSSGSKKPGIQFSSEMIDELQPGSIDLDKTDVRIANPDEPGDPGFLLKDVKFKISQIGELTARSTVTTMIEHSNWQMSSSGFSFPTKDKFYMISAGAFSLDSKTHSGKLSSVRVKPVLSPRDFLNKAGKQKDRFDLEFNDIFLAGVDFAACISNRAFEAESVSLTPVLRITNDRTLPFDMSNKVGKYPHQLLLKMKAPIYINKLIVRNGSVFVMERARKSKLTATIFFTGIQARVSNVTNIEKRIRKNAQLILNATSLFLGKAPFHTEWRLPLNAADTNFYTSGELGAIDPATLNRMIEPLARASIKTGNIHKITFDLKGSDYQTAGKVTFLYDHLKVNVLKKNDDNDLTKRGVVSFLANALIKNSNPTNGQSREGKVKRARTVSKSFFDLLWRSIADGAKEIAVGN